MFPILALMAAGALAGGLTNKKDPMKGALIGAGLGATGGLLAPAALGAAGAAGAAGAGTAATGATSGAGLLANGAFLGEGVASGVPAWQAAMSSSAGGTGISGLLSTASQYAKPAMQVAQSGLLDGQEQQPIQPAQIQQSGGGQQVLASLAQGGGYQEELARSEEERRKRRQGLLGGMA